MITVIIPIYHGKQYIEKQIKQLEAASEKLTSLFGEQLEVIIVNDDPTNPIEKGYESIGIQPVIVNSDINRGIHGARVFGLSFANGDYVHFLDQDDEISPYFYCDQISKIGDADVIYCRGYNGNLEIYNNDRVFEKSSLRENIFDRPPMISPGQALIRKTSIPRYWKDHILENSGADDYFLWLLMAADNKNFILNENKLFKHVLNGINQSSDILKCRLSDMEVVDLMMQSGLLTDNDAELIKEMPDKQFARKNSIQLKAQASLYLLNRIVKSEIEGNGIESVIRSKHVESIAIYGAGELGRRLYEILSHRGFTVICFIDKNADYLTTDIPVYSPEKIPSSIAFDAVLVSLSTNDAEVKKYIENTLNHRTYTIQEIVEELPELVNGDIWEKTWN